MPHLCFNAWVEDWYREYGFDEKIHGNSDGLLVLNINGNIDAILMDSCLYVGYHGYVIGKSSINKELVDFYMET